MNIRGARVGDRGFVQGSRGTDSLSDKSYGVTRSRVAQRPGKELV